MELRLIEREGNLLTIEFRGEDDTLLNLLKQQLLEDEDVITATYLRRHPSLDEPRFVVETREGDPAKALQAAAKAVRAQLDELETAILRTDG